MAHTFRTQGSGASQTLHEIEDEKIPVYDTKAEADADLANLDEGQIVATKDTSTDYESELYNYVDAKLATTTTEVAMDIFKTGSKAQLNKSGNNVQFRYFTTNNSTFNPLPKGQWITIGTIPEGYRPKQALYSSLQGSGGGTKGSAKIDGTTGDIQIYHFGEDSAEWGWEFAINFDYNIDTTNNNFMSVNTLKDAKDYTDARSVRKFNYTMTGTNSVYNDIKALCNQLIGLGVNTYAGTFLRSGVTYGYYSITVTAADGSILNGTVVIDNEQGRTNSYTVSKVNNNWLIMPAMLNNNIHATDCNLVTSPGIYNIDNTTANTPYTGIYGILEAKGYNPDVPSVGSQWIFQSVLDTSGRKFVRHCINPNTMAPISSQWSPWEEEDVLTEDLIVANTPGINGYLSQIKHFLSNVDWSRIDNSSIGYRREFVGSMELSGYWYGTYELSCFGLGYKVINGAIYGEGTPVRFSGFYDINHPNGWRVTLSYNYTYVDIRGQTYINDLNQQLSTALNLVAPQTWDVQHCDCNIEVLGYFYAMGTYDRRGSYACFSGTILSSDSAVNGQTFTAEFEVSRNYWVCHNIVLKNAGNATVDGNSNVYLGGITGTNDCEIIAVRCTNIDMPIIPVKNISGHWYGRATGWDGTSAAGTAVTLEVQFRLL